MQTDELWKEGLLLMDRRWRNDMYALGYFIIIVVNSKLCHGRVMVVVEFKSDTTSIIRCMKKTTRYSAQKNDTIIYLFVCESWPACARTKIRIQISEERWPAADKTF